jgi:hypothetical protein
MKKKKVDAFVFLYLLDSETPPRRRGRFRRPLLLTTDEHR